MYGNPSALADCQHCFDQVLKPPLDKITIENSKALGRMLSRTTVLRVLDEVLAKPASLSEIAARSYAHSNGFHKIILIDHLSEGGWQFRLHIWPKGTASGVSLVESMHEHSFDFVSRVLTGEMENQCYSIHPLNPEDRETLESLQEFLAHLPDLEKIELSRYLEFLEVRRLRVIGSQQAADEDVLALESVKRFVERFGVDNMEPSGTGSMERIVSLQGRYEMLTAGRGEGNYEQRLKEMVSLKPHVVLRLHAGDLYYHPYPIAHRLYIPSGQLNSTIILTTPVSQLGGSLQRPTWVSADQVTYKRRMYAPAELAEILRSYREQLDASFTHESRSGIIRGAVYDVSPGKSLFYF